MTEQRTPEELEGLLLEDLDRLGDRLTDEKFCRELYRGLTERRWFPPGARAGEHVALSWKRAEELINELRVKRGRPAMVLAQTGGEGELDPTVADELGRLGWRSEPLDTSEHDPAHLASHEDPPQAKGDPHAERTGAVPGVPGERRTR
jgi:hypothetical protein